MGLLLSAGIFISSCNISTAGTPDPQIATFAAQTVQAAINAAPLASPTADNPIPVANTATQVVTTPTYSQPMASVGEVTNCRTGPGTNYEKVAQIFPADSVEIVGFFSPNYWIVKTKSGDCWVSGEFTTPVGSFAAVPTVTAPPTPNAEKPKAATFPKNGWTFDCTTLGQANIALTWNDEADNESGYRILRNGEVVAELPADSTSFSEIIALLSGQSVAYQIRAYNLTGETDSAVADITCP